MPIIRIKDSVTEKLNRDPAAYAAASDCGYPLDTSDSVSKEGNVSYSICLLTAACLSAQTAGARLAPVPAQYGSVQVVAAPRERDANPRPLARLRQRLEELIGSNRRCQSCA